MLSRIRQGRYVSRIKELSGLRLPTPKNPARQRRSGIREYIKISDRWQDLYQRIGKSEVKQGISYIRDLAKEVYPALPGQAEPAAVHWPPQAVSGSSLHPLSSEREKSKTVIICAAVYKEKGFRRGEIDNFLCLAAFELDM